MLKVLAIDDLREYLLLMTALLHKLFPGIKVLTTQTGENGIEIAKKELPDTILLDINMPGMDGFQTCKILKKYASTKHIPIIMITGFSSDVDTGRKAIACGAEGLLAKPINEGELLGQVTSALKINEQKKSCKEKDLLLRDIHHRIKNNLSIVSSLLNMQSNHLDDPAAKEAFAETRKRVQAISLLHEKLYLGDNLSYIDFHSYAHDLLDMVIDSFPIPRDTVNLNLDIQNLHFTPDVSIPLGLILTELTTNALKYGSKENETLGIHVRLIHENNHIHLYVSDSGPGFPENLDWKNTETLGLQLVSMLIGQLDGSADMDNQNGTSFHISFPFVEKGVEG